MMNLRHARLGVRVALGLTVLWTPAFTRACCVEEQLASALPEVRLLRANFNELYQGTCRALTEQNPTAGLRAFLHGVTQTLVLLLREELNDLNDSQEAHEVRAIIDRFHADLQRDIQELYAEQAEPQRADRSGRQDDSAEQAKITSGFQDIFSSILNLVFLPFNPTLLMTILDGIRSGLMKIISAIFADGKLDMHDIQMVVGALNDLQHHDASTPTDMITAELEQVLVAELQHYLPLDA